MRTLDASGHDAPPRGHSTTVQEPSRAKQPAWGDGRVGRTKACRVGAQLAVLLLSWTVLAALLSGAEPRTQDSAVPFADMLARAGAQVEAWYARAQSLVSLETVSIQRLRSDLMPDDSRRLEYELRIAWDPADTASESLPDATVLRRIVSVNGRPPREGEEPRCMDPTPVSPEPLAMLLPSRRERFAFTPAGTTIVDGRPAMMIDYTGIAPGTPEITWRDNCVSVSLPGRTRGRIWVDAATYDVLRLDERLIGQFDFRVPRDQVVRGAPLVMTIERADSTIEYTRVAFTDPDETLVLPASVETLQIVRGGSIQRTRFTHRFTDYRRFLTDGRILP